MKKLYIILTLIIVSLIAVFAGDTVKILRIYHHGTFTAVPLPNIDSIDHPKSDGNVLETVIEAIDSTRCIPISEIDSVIVSMVDVDEYNVHVESIWNYAMSIKEKDNLSQYQIILLSWLNSQEWVSRAVIDDTNNIIVVTFTNGIDFLIDFQYASYFESHEDTNSVRVKEDGKETDYIDVSYVKDEKIIKGKGIVYVEGRYMPPSSKVENETEDYEYKLIQKELEKSPVGIANNKIKRIKRDINELDKFNFTDYGIMIISQTHGYCGDYYGSFQIKAPFWQFVDHIVLHGITIYYLGNQDELDSYNWKQWRNALFSPGYVYRVPPKYISKIIGDGLSILYGNYCYSYGLEKDNKDVTVFGNTTRSGHIQNIENLTYFMTHILEGRLYSDAIKQSLKDYYFTAGKENIHCLPATNDKESKLRYFSIKTNDITGNRITGEIKGFDKLKDDVKKSSAYKLYVHEDSDMFTPESPGVKVISDVVKVNSDGTFSVSDDVLIQYGSSGFIVGFEYAGKVYYGEPKWMPEISVSIEDISPICDDYYFTIRGKVNGLENLKYVDVSLDVCKCNKTISDYELEIDYSNYQYDDYKSYNADLDKDNGSIVCRVPRAIGVANDYDANTIYGFTFVIEKRSVKFYSDTKYCIWKLCPDNKHPHSIDLGLSNDIKWACCNVGSNNPENQGGYYAWGETKQKGTYFYDTYNYYEEKIGESNYIHIGNNISGSSYDAARANWGAPWRMPTAKEFNLLDECVHVDATINGMDGVKVIGPNGNSIFIPCAGKMWKNEKQEFGNWGYYWTSILQREYTDWWHMYYEEQFAYYASVTAPFISVNGMPSGDRIEGLSVRPVCNGDTPIDLCLSENDLNMNILDNQIIDITSGSGEYTVSSSNPDVIAANLNCNEVEITANHAGTATITVTDVQTGKTILLTVTVVVAEELKLSTSEISLGVGGISTVNILSGYDTYTISNSNNNVVTAILSGTSIFIKALAEGTAIITITDAQSDQTATIDVTVINSDGPIAYRACPDDNHPHMIDLGLPSGTKWACCNVGAKAPEDFGGYYAWGETFVKNEYNWDNYILCDGSENTCQDIGSVISGSKYDVASVLWGTPWMMPTYGHLEELIDMDICTSEEAVVNGVDGRKFTGPNGSSIFFPFAGSYYSSWNSSKGLEGFYWTGTLSEFADWYTYYLHIEGGTSNASWRFASRSSGLSVRPVCN